MPDRRAFIRGLVLASGATALLHNKALAAFSSLLGNTPDAPVGSLSGATFARLRGATFLVRGPAAAPQPVVLSEVTEYPRGPDIENFSLRFTGAAEKAFAQGIQRFEHPELGGFEAFVVAHPIDATTFGYEAVFNRLVG